MQEHIILILHNLKMLLQLSDTYSLRAKRNTLSFSNVEDLILDKSIKNYTLERNNKDQTSPTIQSSYSCAELKR